MNTLDKVRPIAAMGLVASLRLGGFRADQDCRGTLAHAALGGGFDIPRKDPFDRLQIALVRIERMPIVSNRMSFDAFGGGADLVARPALTEGDRPC
jgi:hypothetical protein